MYSITEARSACDQDSECGGFYDDNCGAGVFRLCGLPVAEQASKCDSVLYSKG